MYKVITEFSRAELAVVAENIHVPPAKWSGTRLAAWKSIGPLVCAHRELITRVLIVQDPPTPNRGEIQVPLPDGELWALVNLRHYEVEPTHAPETDLVARPHPVVTSLFRIEGLSWDGLRPDGPDRFFGGPSYKPFHWTGEEDAAPVDAVHLETHLARHEYVLSSTAGRVTFPCHAFVALSIDPYGQGLWVKALVRGEREKVWQIDLLNKQDLSLAQQERVGVLIQELARSLGAFSGRFLAYVDTD